MDSQQLVYTLGSIAMNREIDIHRSHEAAQRIKAEPRACWRNAILAQQHLPETLYIEGWAVSPDGLVIEHGWLEQDNKVIDPTLISRIEEKEESPTYFSGLRYTAEQTIEAPRETEGYLPLVCRDGYWGRETPSYMIAYCGAWEYTGDSPDVELSESFREHIADTRDL